MPRNGSGNYALPQPPFVPVTTISSASVNSDFSDIATALTDSVAADGQTPITGALKSSVTSGPALNSTVDQTTGFGVSASGEADVWVGGNKVVQTTATTQTVTVNENITGGLTVGGNTTLSGNLTVSGTQTFSGTAGIQIPAGTTVQRPSPVAGMIRYNTSNANYEGYDGAEWAVMSQPNTRYTIASSVNSGLLTISILNAVTGGVPTAADPIAFTFRDSAIGNGDPVVALATSALTIDTNGVGASLGSLGGGNGFRFWIVVFNNAGTPVLALINCSLNGVVYPLMQHLPASSTAMSAAATSPATFYTPNGVTVSTKAFKILGFLEYGSGYITTPGNYTVPPTLLQIYLPGTKLPGDTVQVFAPYLTTTQSSAIATGGPQGVTGGPSVTINLSAGANVVNVRAYTQIGGSVGSTTVIKAQIARGSTLLSTYASFTVINDSRTFPIEAFDNPGFSNPTYSIAAGTSAGGAFAVNLGSTGGSTGMYFTEIMG